MASIKPVKPGTNTPPADQAQPATTRTTRGGNLNENATTRTTRGRELNENATTRTTRGLALGNDNATTRVTD
jgi:hypothetical protein